MKTNDLILQGGKEITWTRVDEQLPEKNKLVLYSEPDHVGVGYYCSKGFWVDYIARCRCRNVIAWAPLPEPYKEEK